MRLQEIADRGPGGETAGNVANERARIELLRERVAAEQRVLSQARAFGDIQGEIESEKRLARLEKDIADRSALVEVGERNVTDTVADAEEERTRIREDEARDRQRIEEQAFNATVALFNLEVAANPSSHLLSSAEGHRPEGSVAAPIR